MERMMLLLLLHRKRPDLACESCGPRAEMRLVRPKPLGPRHEHLRVAKSSRRSTGSIEAVFAFLHLPVPFPFHVLTTR
jgi:hypothetical protein